MHCVDYMDYTIATNHVRRGCGGVVQLHLTDHDCNLDRLTIYCFDSVDLDGVSDKTLSRPGLGPIQ